MIHNTVTSWKETVGVDTSIEKINTYEYEPHQGTSLNDVGDIRITINNEDQFIHPSSSHLYIEGEPSLRTGRKYATDECGISLVNNGLMYLFNRIDYAIANTKIEGFNNPGRATTLQGLLSYPIVYPLCMSFLWSLDENPGITENDASKKRCQYIHLAGNGRFSVMIPLSYMFGFCEQYDKVMYGVKHEITLHRSDDEDAIFRNGEKEGEEDKVQKGRITFTKISWRMPILKLSDEGKISLFGDILQKAVIPIEFLSRQCESIQLNSGQRHLDWRLSVSMGSEKPRYVVLAFQRNKMDR